MTIFELAVLVRKNWKLCVVLPVLCAAIGVGYVFMGNSTSYQSTGTIYALSNTTTAKAFADTLASTYSVDGTSVKVSNASTIMTVTATNAKNGEACDIAVNKVLDEMNTVFRQAFLPSVDRYYVTDDGVRIYKSDAEYAEDLKKVQDNFERTYYCSPSMGFTEVSSSKSLAKFFLIGAIGGFLAAILVVIIMDSIRRPIRGRSQLEDGFGLSTLGHVGNKGDIGERLLANIRFAVPEGLKFESLCLMPLSDKTKADNLVEQLSETLRNDDVAKDVTVSLTEPIQNSIEGAYSAKDSSVTVLVARQWVDKVPMLEDTLYELNLAKANVAGVVLIDENK